jgi:hypothetical protein
MFFKTPRKCQCFGISCEAPGNLLNILYINAYVSSLNNDPKGNNKKGK